MSGSFNPRRLRTARLVLDPVCWTDLADMERLKGDPRAYAMMLGGVLAPARVAEEMARDVALWSREGVGIFTIRRADTGAFCGMTGVHERPDGRGLGLRFALVPEAKGRGFAREAAAAALAFTHNEGIERVVAVARESNIASRGILGGIGMRVAGQFERDGNPMLLYESIRQPLLRV